MSVEIRPIAHDEAPAYFGVLPFSNGLPSWEPHPAAWHTGPEAWPPPNEPATPQQVSDWADELFTDHFHPQAAFVDGDLVGATAMISFHLTVPGPASVPMGGVTGTGVIATHRRRGLLRAMMQAIFEQALERGEPLAGLSASEGSIYGRFGFSPATVRTRWEIQRHEATMLEHPEIGTLQLVDAATAREVWPRLYASVRPMRVGEPSAQPGQWAHLTDSANGAAGPLRFLVHRDEQGQIDGIANYRLPWSPAAEEVGTLVVEAMCAASIEARTRDVAAAARF